jgi:metallo-beta-lactamase family protein
VKLTFLGAPGTVTGSRYVAEVKIHGEMIPVRAAVAQLQALSAHADGDQLMAWLGSAASRPRRTFVTHGESAPAAALALSIREALELPAAVAREREAIELATGRAP